MVRNEEGFCRVCGRKAQCVDHIVPIESGGGDDRANLQALCNRCHSQKTRREQQSMSKVFLVCGPPGSGKTTYCLERMNEGDVIVDLDRIAKALMRDKEERRTDGILELAMKLKTMAINTASAHGIPRVWVVDMGARRREREGLASRLCAEIIMLDIDAATCLDRIQKDRGSGAPPGGWEPVVQRWWKDFRETRS